MKNISYKLLYYIKKYIQKIAETLKEAALNMMMGDLM